MKKLITLLFVFSIISAYTQSKETRKISAHTAISVSTAIQVEYIESNKNEAVIECENKDHIDLILTEVKNGTLVIRYKPNSQINSRKANKVTIYSNAKLTQAEASASGQIVFKSPITATSFSLSANSSGKIETNTITAKNIKIDANSSGKIEANIQASTVNIDASSSGDANVLGKADRVTVDMSSSADLDLSNLKIDDLTINGSSSASLLFHTAQTLQNNLSSSAKVYYSVVPDRITRNALSSGGKFIKR